MGCIFAHGEERVAFRHPVWSLLTIGPDVRWKPIGRGEENRNCTEIALMIAACAGFAMPVFRIVSALTILWLVQPEVIRAPVRYVASSLQDFAGQSSAAPDLLVRACTANTRQCAALAREALGTEPTGAVAR